METGRVKFYNKNEGWGIVRPDKGGPDIFLHAHDLNQSGLLGRVSIECGLRIAFERAKSRTKNRPEGGERAVNINVLG